MIKSIPQDSTKKVVNLLVRINSSYQKLKLYLDIEQYSQQLMWSYFSQGEFYEPEESRFLDRVLQKGDTFIDIGAHIGYYSLLAALRVETKGTVLSFEPNEINYQWIRDNIALNGLNNIQVFQTVLGAENKDVQFFLNADNDGGHALWDVGLHSFNKKSRSRPQIITLKMSTLDDLLKDKSLTGVKLIKIDAEGAEFNILQGAIKTLKTYRIPYVICEINRFALQQMGTTEEQIREFMSSLGYSTYLLRRESPNLVKLLPGQYYHSPYVFNVVFTLNEGR